MATTALTPWFAAASVYRLGCGEPAGGRCIAAKLSLAQAVDFAATRAQLQWERIELRLDDGSRSWSGSEALALSRDPADSTIHNRVSGLKVEMRALARDGAAERANVNFRPRQMRAADSA
jgi:hypothetical protein